MKLSIRTLSIALLTGMAPISTLVSHDAPSTTEASSTKAIILNLLREADIQINGSRPQDITVHDERFYDRVLANGSLGLGESYMDGWWDSRSVDSTIDCLLRTDIQSKIRPNIHVAWNYLKAHLFNLQDKIGSKKVIDQHYNLGNDLYENMLDPLMAYTCGYWKGVDSLEAAQEGKFDLLCKKMKLQPGMTVLDIGCGWGGFEKFAAEKYGVTVVGVTLSENQAEYARNLCKGLPVEIRIQDYRDVEGTFDRIVSIGMFEHVGSKNYKTYMEIASRLLKDDGIFALHTIGRNTSTVSCDPWINTYIFPGGQLPSIAQIGESIEGLFVMEDWHNFGPDYDKTLCSWFANFEKNWPKLETQYGERFFRMWKYYLLSCAGGFRSRTIQLWQIVLTKKGLAGGYESVR